MDNNNSQQARGTTDPSVNDLPAQTTTQTTSYTYPTPTQTPPQPPVVQPVEKVVYTEYKKKGSGCGFIGRIIWQLFTCMGCLLLLLSLLIIGFAVWIHI